MATQPVYIDAVRAAIEQSRPMLDWADNWDGEGSPAYRQETWDRAVDFIQRNTGRPRRTHPASSMIPIIAPGPLGSIDVVWEQPDRRLVINIPVAADELSSYYGAATTGETVEGMLITSSENQWLIQEPSTYKRHRRQETNRHARALPGNLQDGD